MATPRSLVVDVSSDGYYNCTSRCVRGAYLCGDEHDHRREWIRQQLIILNDLFAIDVCGYAVLSNHFHVMLYSDPAFAAMWSPQEVTRRWLLLCPGQIPATYDLEEAVKELSRNSKRVEAWRLRLSSVSWFMKMVKEPIARRANLEDGTTGHFWEGRFHCARVLDPAGLLACCVYYDLNGVRAGLAQAPEEFDFCSIQDRVFVRQAFMGGVTLEGENLGGLLDRPVSSMKHEEDGIWLKPIQNHPESTRDGMFGIALDTYLEIVDAVGRIKRGEARGVIPSHLAPILDRLRLEGDAWIKSVQRHTGRIYGTAIGLASSLAREAKRRGQSTVRSSMQLESD